MRVFWLFTALAAASGCSSYGVRCDTHLRPINTPQTDSRSISTTAGEAGVAHPSAQTDTGDATADGPAP